MTLWHFSKKSSLYGQAYICEITILDAFLEQIYVGTGKPSVYPFPWWYVLIGYGCIWMESKSGACVPPMKGLNQGVWIISCPLIPRPPCSWPPTTTCRWCKPPSLDIIDLGSSQHITVVVLYPSLSFQIVLTGRKFDRSRNELVWWQCQLSP